MNVVNYNLVVPSLSASAGTISSYAVSNITGSAYLTFTITGVDSTVSALRKIVFEFSNDSTLYTLQAPLTSITGLSGAQLTHAFFSGDTALTTYTVNATGYRNNLIVDTFFISVGIIQPSLSQFGGLSILKTAIFDTPDAIDNLLITAETNSPRQVVNFVLSASSL